MDAMQTDQAQLVLPGKQLKKLKRKARNLDDHLEEVESKLTRLQERLKDATAEKMLLQEQIAELAKHV